MAIPTPLERFEAKVDLSGPCWLWTGGLDRYGYGKFTVMYRTLIAHRAGWELLVGPIEAGYELDHTCHQRDSRMHPRNLPPSTLRQPRPSGTRYPRCPCTPHRRRFPLQAASPVHRGEHLLADRWTARVPHLPPPSESGLIPGPRRSSYPPSSRRGPGSTFN